MSEEEPIQYRGWQPVRSGWMGALSLVGMCEVAAAGLLLVLPVYAHQMSREVLAAPMAMALLLAALTRIQGMTADQWVLVALKFQWHQAGRRTVFLSGAFAPRSRTSDRQQMDLPGVLARLQILSVPTGAGEELGMIYDPAANTFSAVLEVKYPGLALVDVDRVNRRVAAWGGLLRSLCVEDGSVVRLAVHERSLPDDGTALRGWVEAHLDPQAPQAAVQVVEELTANGGPGTSARATYLTVTLSAARAKVSIKSAGGGQLGAGAVLVRELGALEGTLMGAELEVVDRLSPRRLAEVIRTAYDPHSVGPMAQRAADAKSPDWQGLPPGVDPALAGPAAAEASWSSYRHDGGHSVTWQVRAWPDGEIYATSLQPLMRPSSVATRSLAMVYEPLGPRKAKSVLSRERTKRDVDRRVRARTGRIESLDERKEAARADEQDAARVHGHGIVRFTALVSLTVMDLDHLEGACAELQQDGAAAGLELRRMWGAQDSGFAAAALPLGQGLPEHRGLV